MSVPNRISGLARPAESGTGADDDAPVPAGEPISTIGFLFHTDPGGPAMKFRNLYGRMNALGHRVRVAFPRGEGRAPGLIATAGIPVDRLAVNRPLVPRRGRFRQFLRFAISFPQGVWRTAAYIRRHRPDVIHVNGAFDVGPAIAGRLTGTPVLWHLNDTAFGPRLSGLMGWTVRRLATVITAAAERVAVHYRAAGADTLIVHSPVATARCAARPDGQHPLAEPLLGLAANWNIEKRQDRFVEVIARLRARGRPVGGIVMGLFPDGQKDWWEPILARMEVDGLDRVIETPGFVTDMPAAMRRLDLHLLTSASEASPICVMEAMSTGVPQVVFDVGGVQEMLGQGEEAAGIVVPEGDVDAMAAGVERLLDDPALYARMSANGRERARTRFSLEACVERHEAAYATAIARKGRRRKDHP